MDFKFGQYTEITDVAFDVNPHYKNEGYVRFFICADVWDFWFCRILEGYNEYYGREEGSYILERDKIAMDKKGEGLDLNKVKRIIAEHDGSSWDIEQSYDIESLIEMVDGGFGILNLKEN